MTFIIIFIVLVVVFAIAKIWAESESKKQIATQITNVPFTFTHRIDQGNGHFTFGVDDSQRKVMIVYPTRRCMFDYEDIQGVEVVVDGTQVASRSLGKVIGAAAIGGVVGAMAVDQNIKKKVSSIIVNVRVRNISDPVQKLVLLDSESDFYKSDLDQANRIADILKVIIDDVERSQQQAAVPVVQPTPAVSEAPSVADEIRKLGELLEAGLISQQEFDDQKKKLLHSR